MNGSDFFCIFNGKLEEELVNEIRKSAIKIDNPIRKQMKGNKSAKKRADAAYDSDEDDEGFSLDDVYNKK